MLRAIVATVAKRKLLLLWCISGGVLLQTCKPIRGDERRNKSQQKFSKLFVIVILSWYQAISETQLSALGTNPI